MRALRGLGSVIYTLVLYLGVPLLGWGLDDLRGFFSVNPRLGYALLILGFGLAVGYQVSSSLEGIRGSKGREGKLVARQHIVRVVVVLLLVGALFFLPFADRRNIGVMIDNQAARWAGLVLFGLGCGLVFWSSVALGRLYSPEVTVQESHHLVTSGLYRHIRHPRYLGAVLLGFGLFLTFRSWIGLVLNSAFIGIILFRIQDEEALMHREFGQEWEAYCEHSWRLIPFVY
jgi:protein-S-isoprenylcysteine O-methyltransferase Ste14